MEQVRVQLGQRSYDILIGSGLLEDLGRRVRELLPAPTAGLISDENVFALYGQRAVQQLQQAGYELAVKVVPPGDKSKSLEQAARIYDVLYEGRIERSSPLVALGGGMVGDLTGFVAATWLRGVPFVQAPTTLEAAIDASIGGKTAVNHSKGKNLIGAFHQPRLVLMDTDTFSTLEKRDVRAGLAESIKHAIIRDESLFAFHQDHAEAILNLEGSILTPLLRRNCQIKAEVVAADERESNVRAILNFGHTIGHAIEALGGYHLYRHGEAVAAGMVAAAHIAMQRGSITAGQFGRIEALIERFGLPIRTERYDLARVMDVMQRDKKVRAGRIRFVLPVRIGEVEIVEGVTREQIAAALDYLAGR